MKHTRERLLVILCLLCIIGGVIYLRRTPAQSPVPTLKRVYEEDGDFPEKQPPSGSNPRSGPASSAAAQSIKDFLFSEEALKNLTEEVTVVTGYLNLGSFQKGEKGMFYNRNLYRQWMTIFGSILNPVVAFMEDDEDVEYFLDIRRKLPKNLTLIYKVNRNETWAFSLAPKILAIFNEKGYPKHHPNTVIPEYSCTMHLKYEFMNSVATKNPHNTKYFAWLDIGLFRDLAESGKLTPFQLWVPYSYPLGTVAYGQVHFRNTRQEAWMIFKKNLTWICGCLFFARVDVMQKWSKIYMDSVEHYLQLGLANTDQQVLYAMINERRSIIDVHEYKGNGENDHWFHLGYLCRKSGMERRRRLNLRQLAINHSRPR